MSTADAIKASLGKYVLAMNRMYRYVPFHQELLVPALEKIARGEIKRLMINLPPRHGKTEITTISMRQRR